MISHPGYEGLIPKLKSNRNLRDTLKILRGDRSVRAELIRDRVGEIRRLNEKIAAVEKQMATKVMECGTSLTQLRGIRFIVAAKILGEIGDPARLRSKGSFAMMSGTAPVEASSGRTKRHRLNRRQSAAQLRAPHDGDRTLPWGPRYEDLRGEASE